MLEGHLSVLLSAADKAEIATAVRVFVYLSAGSAGLFAAYKLLWMPLITLMDNSDAWVISHWRFLGRFFRRFIFILLTLLLLGLAMEMVLNQLQRL